MRDPTPALPPGQSQGGQVPSVNHPARLPLHPDVTGFGGRYQHLSKTPFHVPCTTHTPLCLLPMLRWTSHVMGQNNEVGLKQA